MTDAELAILSIVAEGPIHGYDIQTIITQRGLRAWTNIGVSSMYYVIDKLARQGLVESRPDEHTQGPSRRQYRITPAGYGVLQTAVVDLLSTPRDHASGFELGLANLYVLRSAQLRNAFIAYQQELMSRLEQALNRWRQLEAHQAAFNVVAIFEHRVAMLEAELNWVTHFIAQWEAQAPPADDEAYVPEPAEIPRAKQVMLPHDPDSFHRASTPAGPDAPHLKRTVNRVDRGTPPYHARPGLNVTGTADDAGPPAPDPAAGNDPGESYSDPPL